MMIDKEQADLNVISDYIDSIFIETTDYDTCIKQMNKLNLFVGKNKYNIRVDAIIDFINKKTNYRLCIANIFNKNVKAIVDGNSENIFRNRLLINSIDIYCMINNIEIKTMDESYEITNKDLSDGLYIYFKEIANFRVLTYDEEQILSRRALSGDEEAKEELINHNLRLVVRMAKRYINKGLSLQDLIQEGNIGLMTAVDKFDPDLGFKFSTYAYNWIKQGMTRALANYSKTIRLPVYQIENINRYNSAVTALTRKLNREPTLDEISKVLGISVEKINKLKSLQVQDTSLDVLIGEDSDTELSSMIPDPNTNVEDEAMDNVVRDDIAKLIKASRLSDKEMTVIIYRFGLNGDRVKTLEEIGEMYGVTRERVRQIEARALVKMRRNKHLVAIDSRISSNPITPEIINGTIKNKQSIKGLVDLHKLYNFFNAYSKDEVDTMLNELPPKDKRLVVKVYASGINDNTPTQIKENSLYLGALISKMRRILRRIHSDGEKNKEEEINKAFSDSINEKKEANEKYLEEVKKSIKILYSDVTNEPIVKQLEKTMKEKDYNRLIEVLKISKIKELFYTITKEELIILLLCFGFINRKYFQLNEIAYFLGIEEEQVKTIANTSFAQYDNDIINVIDEALGTIVYDNRVLKKELVKR